MKKQQPKMLPQTNVYNNTFASHEESIWAPILNHTEKWPDFVSMILNIFIHVSV